MPTGDATLQCNFINMYVYYVKIFTERVNFFLKLSFDPLYRILITILYCIEILGTFTYFIGVVTASPSEKKQYFDWPCRVWALHIWDWALISFIRKSNLFVGDDFEKIQLGSVAVVDNFCPYGWLIYHWFALWEDWSKIHVAWRSGETFI